MVCVSKEMRTHQRPGTSFFFVKSLLYSVCEQKSNHWLSTPIPGELTREVEVLLAFSTVGSVGRVWAWEPLPLAL